MHPNNIYHPWAAYYYLLYYLYVGRIFSDEEVVAHPRWDLFLSPTLRMSRAIVVRTCPDDMSLYAGYAESTNSSGPHLRLDCHSRIDDHGNRPTEQVRC
jgi:hypothetical protein